MKIKYIWLLLLFTGLTACDGHDYTIPDNTVELDSGSADFSRFVAVGNSLTAGYTDKALFIAAQENSIPNILAQKMALAGGGDFTQPMTDDNIGGLLLGGNVIQTPRLYFDGSGPAVLPGTPTTEVSNIKNGPYNNMGVPGARSFHLIAPGYGNMAGLPDLANPYFVRMASSPNTSVLADAMAMDPTFFMLWIGNNDVLGYATSGGDGSSEITPKGTFDYSIDVLVSTLTSGGAKGVMLNIPDVSTIPFFTTIPYAPLDPSNPDFGPMIPLLNATFKPLNQAFAYLGVPERSIVFYEDQASPLVIQDESIPDISAQLFQVLMGGGLDQKTAFLMSKQFGQCRQAKEIDLFPLTGSTVIATLNEDYFKYLLSLGVPADQAGQLSINGITYPMQDRWVLLPSEQLEVGNAVKAFNATIESQAAAAGLAFVDANLLMKQIATTGIPSDGFLLKSDLVTGGAFSLDGVHPTARGYALIANEILKAIDRTYGSNFAEADELNNIGDYPIVYSPQLN